MPIDTVSVPYGNYLYLLNRSGMWNDVLNQCSWCWYFIFVQYQQQ